MPSTQTWAATIIHMILGKPLVAASEYGKGNDHEEREGSQTPEEIWPQWFLGRLGTLF
jgi:hypothetical protein